jgi:hypothetical protein
MVRNFAISLDNKASEEEVRGQIQILLAYGGVDRCGLNCAR